MTSPSGSLRQSGSVRWWMPLLCLAGGTVALIFLGWMAGVDVKAAGTRIHSDLLDFFHNSSWEETNEAGTLRLDFDGHHRLKRASHDGAEVPLADVSLQDDYVTVSSLTWEDGELMYWRLPMHTVDVLREEASNPRWRLLTRLHPRPEGEPAGLRVARLAPHGPGDKAGLHVGDFVVAVNGCRAPTSAGLEELLRQALAECLPGGTLVLLAEHDGEEHKLSIPLPALVSQADWEATSGDDPIERYLDIRDPGWNGRHGNVRVHVRQQR